jgi:hypothetical protein
LQDDEDIEQSEGFWREFFLLRPDRNALKEVLGAIRPSDVLALEDQTRELFARAIITLKENHGSSQLHALDVCLAMFLSGCRQLTGCRH